jgi:ankyrin repeat protein
MAALAFRSILVEVGVTLTHPDQLYQLYLTIVTKNAPACEILVRQHADILNPFLLGSGDYQLSPLNAAASTHGGDMDVFNHFLSRWNPNNTFTRSLNGDLPIHLLCHHDDVSVELVSEQYPTHVATVNDHDNTPIHIALMVSPVVCP